jgi:hypothetical protein
MTVAAPAHMKVISIPENYTFYAKSGVEKACELRLQRLLPVEKQDTLTELIQFL